MSRMYRKKASGVVKVVTLLVCALLLTGVLAAGEAPEQIVVTGRLPGPPLWKITRGQHTLWLFADLPVVPGDLSWDTSRVAQILSEAEVFVSPPRIKVGSLAAMLGLRKSNVGELVGALQRLDEGHTLQQVIEPALYQRLSENVPPDMLRKYSHYKPWQAALRLMDFWMEREGFSNSASLKVNRELDRLRRKYRVRKVSSDLAVALAEFEQYLQTQMAIPEEHGSACLAAMLDLRENAETVKQTLTRWFAGELPVSSALDPLHLCQETGPLPGRQNLERSVQMWVSHAEQALANHKVSFAVVPIGLLLGDEQTAFRQWLLRENLDIKVDEQ